ncbi:60S ribosomal protein RML2 [Uncinocarpus reesii 1704]|uniref:Large ribosomal subunit protein uL2m n=1 Tax=Uncinocarpus reesii (strain UAMH 1704) TaxID=336963 RepID=C4JSD4_UNCRE|nr:60S ribosomal protein RML2 [Uncinocarpus reesii 1704]EEP80531.1 60S ribosomal protein RML2 [Uncinocarpus reesii 1704]
MLQPRIPLRGLQHSCKYFSSLLSRTYATVVESQPAAPEASVDTISSFVPPPSHAKGGAEIRRYKPRTPGLRHLRRPVNDHLWKGRPIHELTFPKKGQGKGGRNNTGHITVRHRGGGHKRRIRMVDFNRKEPGPHLVERIEHDPNRSAHIALIRSKLTKKRSYIIATEGMRAGDVVQSYRAGIPQDLWDSMGGVIDPGVLAARTAWRGNCLPLHMIPIGTLVYNVGLHKDKGGQLCRSAGTFATIVAKAFEGFDPESDVITDERGETKHLTLQDKHRLKKLSEHVTLRLQSGEIRLIHKDCCATIGVASNENYHYRQLGKAGRKRWLGIRPTVRGLAMNAMDHPHGGGRGKSKGNVHPKSPWGLPAKSGYKTRPKRKVNKMVVTPRPRNQGKRRRGYN